MGFEAPIPDFISSPGASQARAAYAKKMGTYNPEAPVQEKKPAGPKGPSRADRLKAMEDMERRHAENAAADAAQHQALPDGAEENEARVAEGSPDADVPT